MKKTNTLLMMATIAATALVSCSQEEPIDTNKGRAIDFRSAMNSRATETTNANLTSIKAAAFMGNQLFFPVMDFNKDADGFFSSATEYYWPGDNTELTFYAYSPENPGGTVALTADAKTMTDYTTAASMADQTDFITASAIGTKSENEASGVPLTFNHQLSQIEVRAKSSNEAYSFAISGVRIGEPVSKGDFDFTSTAWTLGTDKAIYTDTYTDAKELTPDAVSVMGAGGNAMLLPQQLVAWNPDTDASNASEGAYISVKLNVTTTETGVQVYPFPTKSECEWAAIPIDTKWEAGKKYIYTLDFTHGAGYVDPNDPVPGVPVLGGPIKFTVDVEDWVDTPTDLPMITK